MYISIKNSSIFFKKLTKALFNLSIFTNKKNQSIDKSLFKI